MALPWCRTGFQALRTCQRQQGGLLWVSLSWTSAGRYVTVRSACSLCSSNTGWGLQVFTCVFCADCMYPQNFYPGVTTVTIGDVPCTGVQLTDNTTLGSLRCTAPPGPGNGNIFLRVAVADGGNASTPFLYDAPTVTGVNVAAAPAEATVVIQVTGTNIGPRSSVNSPDPVVYIQTTLGTVCASSPCC